VRHPTQVRWGTCLGLAPRFVGPAMTELYSAS